MPDRVLSAEEMRDVLRLLVRELGVTPVPARRPRQMPTTREPIVLPPAGPCRHYIAASDSYCGVEDTHRYSIGPRCAAHSPAARRRPA